MGYYTKIQVSEKMKEILERAKNGEINIMTNIEESARMLGDEEHLIPIFWVETQPVKDSVNIKMKMDGLVFVRIDYDLYSDDRFAIDSFQASKEGVPVSEIIKRRNEEKASVNSMSDEDKTEIENKLKNALKNAKKE